MKYFFFFCLFFFIPHLASANTYIEQKINGHVMKVIEYNLSDPNYEIKIIKSDDATNLANMLTQNNAITWVNGAFFCPVDYKWCGSERSYSDSERYIKWEKFATQINTGYRAVFAWDQDKNPFIYRSGIINEEDEDQIYYGIGNLPLILYQWQNMLQEYWDNNQIVANMKPKAVRNFICSDKTKEHIYFWLVWDANIDDMVEILKDFWCWDALNLDAGLSTSLIYNNTYILGSKSRDIMDGVAIERVGIDKESINKKSQILSDAIKKLAKNKSKKNTILFTKYIDSYQKQLKALKAKIYAKYTTDVYQTNIVWEQDRVGYKIDVTNKKDFQKILILNQSLENLKETP